MPPVHVFFNTILIILFFLTGIYLKKKKKAAAISGCGAVFLLFLGYILPLRPDILLMFLPFSFALFYTNYYPWAVAIFAPTAFEFGKNNFHKIRIVVLLCALFFISLYPFKYFLMPPAITGKSVIDENNICRQTSAYTCSAAACVTLLLHHGIITTEKETAKLALTKENSGTRTLGEYRAIKILAEKNNFRVRIKKADAKNLKNIPSPSLVTVGLDKRGQKNNIEKDLQNLYQWTPGVMHSVVYLGKKPGEENKIQIGEPDFGLETWWDYQFKSLVKGCVIYLEAENKKSEE
jgi:hypothetical protein